MATAKKKNLGRPKKFTQVEEMQKAIDAYFRKCDSNKKEIYNAKTGCVEKISYPIPYTVEGLCNSLGIDRDTLLNYEKREEDKIFFGTIKTAKLRIQQNHAERALQGENNPAVSIFIMKNNFGYKDKIEQEITGKDGEDLIKDRPMTKQEFKTVLSEIEKDL